MRGQELDEDWNPAQLSDQIQDLDGASNPWTFTSKDVSVPRRIFRLGTLRVPVSLRLRVFFGEGKTAYP